MSFEIFVLGTGGMMPLPNRFLTSVLLRREGSLFLFDCGEGTQISLRSLNLKWKKVSAVFVSHTHADHITGIPGLLMLSAQVDRDEPLIIVGPPKIKEYVETSRRVLDMYINYEIIVKEISDPSVPGEVFRGDDFSVYSFPLNHSKVCVGYKLVEDPRPGVFDPAKAEAAGVPRGPLWSHLQRGETVVGLRSRPVKPEEVLGPPRRGCRFSFVTDTAYLPTIAGEVSGSDLFIGRKRRRKKTSDGGAGGSNRRRSRRNRTNGLDSLFAAVYQPRFTAALKRSQSRFSANVFDKGRNEPFRKKQRLNVTNRLFFCFK